MTYPHSVCVACGLSFILALNSCASSPTPTEAPGGKSVAKGEIIKLEHVEAKSVVARLRKLNDSIERGAKLVVVAHEESNSLLLSGQRKYIVQAKDLIAILDKPIK